MTIDLQQTFWTQVCPLRTLEIAFLGIKFSKFSGQAIP